MTEPVPPPTGPSSTTAAALRLLGVAAAIVLGVSGLFWLLGALGDGDEPGLVIADGDDAPENGDGGTDEPSDGSGGSTGPDGDDGEEGPGSPPEGEGDSAPDPDAEPDPEPDPDPDADPDPEPDTGPSLDPAGISVQVLDGYKSDGGAAATGVAGELRDAGYDVVAQNPALSYDVTTVLYTAGNEPAARQIAALLDAPEVRQQSGNLSTGVMVHVVVGADRA